MKKFFLSIIPLMSACAGEPSNNIGVRENKLSPCPESPNCVSSFETDDMHKIKPIYADLDRITQVIIGLNAANIVNASDNFVPQDCSSLI